jgi:hypothetical protein
MQYGLRASIRCKMGQKNHDVTKVVKCWQSSHYRKLLNFHRPSIGQGPMEDKPKPTEEDFFHRLHLIFRRSLVDGSY